MRIFSNLATSLDGKIATPSRALYPLGTAEDRRQMQVLRAKSDVVVLGASSLRAFRLPCTVSGPPAKGLKKQPANAILSSALEGLSPGWPFFTRPGFHRILFVSAAAPASRLKRFEKTCEIVVLGKPSASRSTTRQLLDALSARNYRNVLVEGGGSVMWGFVRENLIDEYHVTLTPKLIGGLDSPTLVDGAGFEPRDLLNLKLKSCRKVRDELYLVYGKTRKRG
jgi:riboflavin-specific deaminase-like protein